MTKIFVVLADRDLFADERARRREELLELAGEYLREPVMLIEPSEDAGENKMCRLGENIKRMAVSDYVLLGDGFDSEDISRLEMGCALKCGKKILLEHNRKLEEVI